MALIAGGSGYWFLFKTSDLKTWSFVPDNSISVYEPADLSVLLSSNEDRKILKNLKNIPSLRSLSESFEILEKLDSALTPDKSIIDNTKTLVSFHMGNNSPNTLAPLFIIEVKSAKSKLLLDKIKEHLLSEGYKEKDRAYQGYTINELIKKDTHLAYIQIENFIIASTTPFLVDDAIRTMEKSLKSPISKHSEIELARNQKLIGNGRVYINNKELSKYINRITDSNKNDFSWLRSFCDLYHLDLKVSEDRIDLEGFAILNDSNNYLSIYNNVRGVGFEMKNVIPDHANMVVHISFDDILAWKKGLKAYWTAYDPSYISKLGEIENRYFFDTKTLFENCKDELGLFVLDEKKNFVNEKIIALEHKDQYVLEKIFTEFSDAVNQDTSEVFVEYANRRIGYLPIDNLPSRMFGDMFNGFSESYYWISNKYLFIGSSQRALEILIDDMDKESTWQKSVRTNNFLESTHEDAAFSVYTKGQGSWDLIKDVLNKDLIQSLNTNRTILNQIEHSVIQFTKVDDHYYTNIALHHPGRLEEQKEVQDFEVQSQLSFDVPLISKPFGVRSHKDGSLEMMIQDSLYNLHLVDKNQELELTIPLESELVSPVYQVDFYKNKKYQYLFALENTIHIIDRTGTYIPGYPITIEDEHPIKYLSLIDYNKSRDYRVMVATSRNNYYLLDKTGKQLEGWNPKTLSGIPIMKGEHARVRRSDFMLFLHEDGILHGISRKSIPKPGFPVDLKGTISSPLNISKGATLKDSKLTAVTNTGDLLSVNLEGNIVRKDQLYKESIEDVFQLVNASDANDYIVTKVSNNTLSIFNRNLEELFQVNINSQNLVYQYYQFTPNNELIIVTDQENDLNYLYDLKGRTLHKEPLPSGKKIAVLFSEAQSKYEVYCTVDNKIQLLTLDI